MYGVLNLRSHRVPSFGAFYRLLPAWLRRTAAAALTLGTIGALGAILTVMAEDPGVRVPVIMYHAVMDDASRLGKYVISPEELESDFKWLSENGYTAVLSEDLINYTENGAARACGHCICGAFAPLRARRPAESCARHGKACAVHGGAVFGVVRRGTPSARKPYPRRGAEYAERCVFAESRCGRRMRHDFSYA